ncbi:hypothetical protein [uncultured Nostoc sp.]|uniref:hypothetical protein n=1 Tax=uncultured Nostoc sp. TaxID=340711 RepID=UPI0035CB90C6
MVRCSGANKTQAAARACTNSQIQGTIQQGELGEMGATVSAFLVQVTAKKGRKLSRDR